MPSLRPSNSLIRDSFSQGLRPHSPALLLAARDQIQADPLVGIMGVVGQAGHSPFPGGSLSPQILPCILLPALNLLQASFLQNSPRLFHPASTLPPTPPPSHPPPCADSRISMSWCLPRLFLQRCLLASGLSWCSAARIYVLTGKLPAPGCPQRSWESSADAQALGGLVLQAPCTSVQSRATQPPFPHA